MSTAFFAAESAARAGESTAKTNPTIAAQHDVDAVPSQPRALVETVGRSAWKCELTEDLEPAAERRRPAERELEQSGLVRPQPAEAEDARRSADVEAAAPRRRSHVDERALRRPDLR